MEPIRIFTPQVIETLIICLTVLIAILCIAMAIVACARASHEARVTQTRLHNQHEIDKIKLDHQLLGNKHQWEVADRREKWEHDLKNKV